MDLSRRIWQAASIGMTVAREPSQARHVPALLRTQGRSTTSVRLPWLPFDVIHALERVISPRSVVFEFGGGGSTLWFSDLGAAVTTVESDPEWYRTLQAATEHLQHVDVRYAVADGSISPYVQSIDGEKDGSIDIVLIDGRERMACLKQSVPKVRAGGLLILDDSDRPKYSEAFHELSSWPSREYAGLVPCKDRPSRTTIWRRPE